MRLVDADAYSAEMKDRQAAAWKWRNEAIAEEDEVKLARAEGAYTAFTEAKLTMDKHIINPWHRVEDELPEPIHPTDPRYKAYLICDSLGYMHVADYTYSKHFPTCYSFHVNGEEETDVKYWMPIEPPKEGV